jgi:NADPH-dependent 2,4-dienoyl-CoA reductase/sulfur reductase-like enzyme
VALHPEDAVQERGIDVRTLHEVVSLDRGSRLLTVRNLRTGRFTQEEYGVLVLATGAGPVLPQAPGLDLPGVFSLKEFQDGIGLKAFISNQRPARAVILGGGFIGVEMAESFTRLGMEVTIVDAASRVLPAMDPQVSAMLADELRKAGVRVVTGRKVSAIEGDVSVRSVILDDGSSLDAGCVLLSIGVSPNSEVAGEAGLALGPRGAVSVDRYQRTSDPDIFAAGDCCTVYHRVLCRDVYMPLGLTANRQGRTCGMNVAALLKGGMFRPFPGVVGTAVIRVFDLEVARTGIGTSEMELYDLRHISSTVIMAKTMPGYFPGSSDILVKLFFEDDTGVVVGCQIAGGPGSALRIDTAAAAVTMRMRLDELYALDTAYAPPISPVWDPLIVAAKAAMRQ